MDMFFIFCIPAFAELIGIVREFGSPRASNAEKKSAALVSKIAAGDNATIKRNTALARRRAAKAA